MPSSHLDYTKALCSIVYTSCTVINLQPQHTSLIGSNHLLSMCTGSQTDTRGWQYGDKQTGSPQSAKPPIWQWHFSLEEQLPLRLTASGCQSHSHEREIEQWSDTTQPLLYSCERKDIISQTAAGLFVLNQERLCRDDDGCYKTVKLFNGMPLMI